MPSPSFSTLVLTERFLFIFHVSYIERLSTSVLFGAQHCFHTTLHRLHYSFSEFMSAFRGWLRSFSSDFLMCGNVWHRTVCWKLNRFRVNSKFVLIPSKPNNNKLDKFHYFLRVNFCWSKTDCSKPQIPNIFLCTWLRLLNVKTDFVKHKLACLPLWAFEL